MQVDLLFFGVLKDVFGAERDSLEIAPGATVADLLDRLRQRVASSPAVLRSLAVAVNREYAQPGTLLADGDEVALLPPVSGGSHAADDAESKPTLRIEILDHELPIAEIIAQIKSGPDGAICTFDGIVRDNTRGRKTLYLDYEAYREMALAQMQTLAAEALKKFPVRDISMLHRLGRIEVGETSVLIVVASAHRGAAFDACRWLIDTLKKQVPIWKKETFADGAVWADGEPFPEKLSIP